MTESIDLDWKVMFANWMETTAEDQSILRWRRGQEELIEGLTREVEEETGLAVARWQGPLWSAEAEAPDMGWTLRVEVHRAHRQRAALKRGSAEASSTHRNRCG